MTANYWDSTQRQKWQFTREQISSLRSEILQIEQSSYDGAATANVVRYDMNLRIYLHQLIVKLGRRLNFRQVILATAEVYMTRFLLKAAICEVNVYLLVSTCLYVACKIEECPQHIRTILSESRSCWPEFIPNDLTKLAEFEFYLIDELDCYLVVYHPYNSVTEVIKALKTYNEPDQRLDISPEELQTTWSIINDSYILDLHLLFPPHIIAVAALYLTLILDTEVRKVNHSVGTHLETASQGTPSGGSLAAVISGTPLASGSDIGGSGIPSRSSLGSGASSAGQSGPTNDTDTDNARISKRNGNRTLYNQRIEVLIRFLAQSKINLQEVIETVQELLTLYDSWASYDEVTVRNRIHTMLLSINMARSI